MDKTALAAVVLMAGMIVLLLAGTAILNWYWPVLVTIVSLGIALYRVRATIPSLYAIAQMIDRRLKLADALSTAFYFAKNPHPELRAVCERQHADAENLARTVDLEQALPFKRSRYVAPAAGLALVALGLFGVRFLLTGTLTLEPSLVRLAYDSFFGSKPYAENRPPRAKLDPRLSGENQDGRTTKEDNPEDLLDNAENLDANSTDPQSAQNGSQNGTPDDNKTGDKGKEDQNQKGDQKASGNDPADQNNKEGDNSKQGDQKGDPKASNNQNSSMMDKLRDAVSNMLNKMKSAAEGKESQKNSQQGQPGDRQDAGQKGQQGKEQAQNASTGDQQGQDSDQQDSSDSNANQSSDKKANQEAQSGAGVKNGEKAIREAEQLQAMGKISEILGKRSANVTGDVMIEVGSSKQQIKTPWAQREATHSEAGGEIHRDEVPLMYQQFVEQYFEEIRKTAPGSASARPSAKQAGKTAGKREN